VNPGQQRKVTWVRPDLPDRSDAVQWELVNDDLLVLDAAQGTVYRFSDDEPDQLRRVARHLLVAGPNDRADMAGAVELASVADVAVEQRSGLLSRRALMKTAAAAGIAIGFSTLVLPSAAAAQSEEPPSPDAGSLAAIYAIPGETSIQVIGIT
jgi:hypothetical protein